MFGSIAKGKPIMLFKLVPAHCQHFKDAFSSSPGRHFVGRVARDSD